VTPFSNLRFERALSASPAMAELQNPIFKVVGAVLFGLGNLFVLSSMYALGVTGTYLGTIYLRCNMLNQKGTTLVF